MEGRKVLLLRKFHYKNDRNINFVKIFHAVASEAGKTRYRPIPPYTLTFVENPTPPTTFDPKVQEHRRRLRSLTKAAFPDGRFPNPYTSICINEFGGDAHKNLSFVRASLVITPDVNDLVPPEQRFSDVWCCGIRGQLNAPIRRNETSGTAFMSIK